MFQRKAKDQAKLLPRVSEDELGRLPPFRYEQLPDGNHFRLLKTISADAKTIYCSFGTFSMGQASYAALSYTWGSAATGDGMTSDKTKTIICNGRALAVTENLWWALCVVQSEDHLWVDAICINQEDLEERKQQVAIMGQIYARAWMVVVWLGPPDNDTELAINTIKDFTKRYRSISHGNERIVSFIGQTSFWEKMGRNSFSNHEANVLARFYNRLWFERAWVLQEVILASEIGVVCGSTTIDWEDIVTMSLFLFNGGYASAWHALRVADQESPYAGALAAAPTQMNKMRIACKHGVALNEDKSIQLDELSNDQLEVAFCQFLSSTILMSRTYDCGRPEDKVYAPLALVIYKFSARLEAPLMVPDYAKHVDMIYTEAASLIISRTQDLMLLTAREDMVFRSRPNLPSWVPDFSVKFQSPLRGLKFRPKFDAMDGNMIPFSIRIDRSCLETIGVWVDTVLQVGLGHDPTSESEGFSVSPTKYLEFALAMGDRYRTGEDRISAFMRIFIADQLPDKSANLFKAYVAYTCVASREMAELLHEITRITGIESLEGRLNALIQHPQHLPRWAVLDAVFGADGPTFQQVVLWMKSMASGVSNGEQNKTIDTAQHLMSECHISAFAGRRLFKGRSGYVGLMPQSARFGDEVWILPGNKTPVVLRQTATEKVFHYVGEAYVLGIMYGEFWKDDNHVDPELITLI